MTKAGFSILFILLSAQVCLPQQKGPSFRVGDAMRGNIRTVRMETARLRIGSSGELAEESPVLEQLITYSEDLLTKESISYQPDGSVRQKSVAVYLPDGNRLSLTVSSGDGSFVARLVYEYDGLGHQISETRYNSDGSVKETILVHSTRSGSNLTAITRVKSDGAPVDVAVNSRDATQRKSTWTYTRADGSHVENSFQVDKSGTHHDESITYKPDGSVAGRRVSIVDAGVNRLEATEYDADGNVRSRSLHTREYDSSHNLSKLTNYSWNDDTQKFEPSRITYYKIIYRD